MNTKNEYGLTPINPSVALADGSFVAETPDYSRLGRSVSFPDGAFAVEVEGLRDVAGQPVDEAKVQVVATVTPEKDAWQVSFGSGDRKEGNILERLAAKAEAAIENTFGGMTKNNVPDATGSIVDRAASVRQGFADPSAVLPDAREILMRSALLDRTNAPAYKEASIDLQSGRWSDAEVRLSRTGAKADKDTVTERLLSAVHGTRSMDEVHERLKAQGMELLAGDSDWSSIKTASGNTYSLAKPTKDQPAGLSLVDDLAAAREAWSAGLQANTEPAAVERGFRGPMAGRRFEGWGRDIDPGMAMALDRERGQEQAYAAIIASLSKDEAKHLLTARTDIMRGRMAAGRSDTAISVEEMSSHLAEKGVTFGTVRSSDGTQSKGVSFAEKLSNTQPPDEAKLAMRRWMSATVSDVVKDLVERGIPPMTHTPDAARTAPRERAPEGVFGKALGMFDRAIGIGRPEVGGGEQEKGQEKGRATPPAMAQDGDDVPTISGGAGHGKPVKGYVDHHAETHPSETSIRAALAKHGISMVRDTDRNGGWKFSASAQGVGHFTETAKDLGFDGKEDPSLDLSALMAAGDRANHVRKCQRSMQDYLKTNGAGTVVWDDLNKQMAKDGMRIQVMGAKTYVDGEGRVGIARRLGITDEKTGIAMAMDTMGMGDATLHEVGKVQENYNTKPFTDNLRSEWGKFVGLFESQLFGYHRSAPRHAAPERIEARHRPERVTWDDGQGASSQRAQSRGR